MHETERKQFHLLYREFLFRAVDLELLSPQGDFSKLLGQFAALLIFVSSLFAWGALSLGDPKIPRNELLINAWSMEHMLIATTMLVVGIFAVLSWDSTFPDRRDVFVFGPLPVRVRTLFLAKVAASGSALSLAIGSLNIFPGLIFPLALAPSSNSLLDLILSPERYRLFFAYWVTMLTAGGFLFCCVLSIQGIAAQLLPRRRFLKLSALLQMAAFCLFVCVYFLQPAFANLRDLSTPGNQMLLQWLPSYWFLGLFQQLNGSVHPATAPLAVRAWMGLGTVAAFTATIYLLSYFRTLRLIVEQPDILPGAHGWNRLPRFGNSLSTAIVQFSIRTLMRSRQHRVTLAFYLGIGFAIAILFMRSLRHQEMLRVVALPSVFSSLVMICACVVGLRVVMAMPIALNANWIFRVTEIRQVGAYLSAIRLPMFVLGVAPAWMLSAVFFLSVWQWRPAVEHLIVLGLWGMTVAWVSLSGFQKIPFTCSWLPGRSFFHMAFLGALLALQLLVRGAAFELRALQDDASFLKLIGALVLIAAIAMWWVVTRVAWEWTVVQFEEEEAAAIMSLKLESGR